MKYRKKPVVIEAVLWDGSTASMAEIALLGTRKVALIDAHLEIETLEGVMRANLGDYIIRGIKGEMYPCKPDIFAETYEPVIEPLIP